jgi:hypothetical protein
MATPGKAQSERSEHLSELTNAELGVCWADAVRSYATRRTGTSRDFWRGLLDEPALILMHGEFRRRALEAVEEYDAWCSLVDAPRT